MEFSSAIQDRTGDVGPAAHDDLRRLLRPAEAWMALAYFGLYWPYLFWYQESELWHWGTMILLPFLLTFVFRMGTPAALSRTLASFGLRRGNLLRGLWATLALGLGVGLVQVFLSRSGPDVLDAITSGRVVYLLPLAFVLLLVLTGLTEEFFFRGFLQTRLELLLRSRWGALAVTTLLFGAYHVPYAYFNPNWPSAGDWGAAWATGMGEGILGGLVLGGLYLYTRRNLLMCIILHALIDAFPAMTMIRFGGS